MIRKYHNHKLQTTPWHREEELLNHHETPGRQIKQSNQLSLKTCKVVFCLPFICKHVGTLVKTIRCYLTKHVGFSQLSQNHYIRIWGYFLKSFKTFVLFIEELYARLYHWYMFEALSLLVY